MCGRFSHYHSIEEVCERFGAIAEEFHWTPRYNIAPTQKALTIISDRIGERKVLPMVWGLIPSWSKDPKMGARLINARSETLTEKPSFREPFQRRRCLIPADGFYEWQGKQPYYIRLKSEQLFSMAGLWETWRDAASQELLHSFTIVTTQSNALLEKLHDRMPVILTERGESSWLNPHTKQEHLKQLLSPYKADEMDYYPVSTFVSSWKNEGDECIRSL